MLISPSRIRARDCVSALANAFFVSAERKPESAGQPENSPA
jgi:hypothetical protein